MRKPVSYSTGIGQNLYHLEWCPKYRYNMFRSKKNEIGAKPL